MLDIIDERVITGTPVLKELFKMPCAELKEKLTSIIKHRDCGNIDTALLIKEGEVSKISKNDDPWEIKINFYDNINVDFMGISLKPEHGSSRLIVPFDSHFKL